MRLGGPVFGYDSPSSWAAAHAAAGYGAAYWPHVPPDQEAAYRQAAEDAGLVIAEVGAWSNPMHPDPEERRKAFDWCVHQLAVADRVGARCCVNISGSMSLQWDGPYPDFASPEAFQQVMTTTQAIIDAVGPTRTYYTLETMPWMLPYSTSSYQRLLGAMERERFAVHLDPVNMICSPSHYFDNANLIRDAITKLGPRIRSCHAKDIILHPQMTVHLDEVAPGEGGLDYAAYLQALDTLDPDVPLMLEHLPEDAYPKAAAHIRRVADTCGVMLR